MPKIFSKPKTSKKITKKQKNTPIKNKTKISKAKNKKDVNSPLFAKEDSKIIPIKSQFYIEDKKKPEEQPKKETMIKSKIQRAIKEEQSLQKEESEKKSFNKIKKYSSMYRGIAYFFIFLVILLVGLIFYFSFSGVKITILPSEEKVKNNLSLTVYDESQKESSDKVKGLIRKMEISSKNTYKASGQKVLSESVVGKVTVINNYNKNQPLIATTRLLTSDDKLFRIKKTINVPAGGRVEAEVYADKPSDDMLIIPTKFTIPGLWSGLQDKIFAESKESMHYERSGKTFVSQEDIDKAVESEKKNLLEKAKKEAEEKYNQYDIFFYKLDNNSITQNIVGEVGEERDDIKVEVKANVVVIAFNKDSAALLAEEKFQSVIPVGKESISFNSNKIEYVLGEVDFSNSSASIVATFEGRISLKAGSEIIDKKQLAGLTKEQLKKYLDLLPEIAAYEIKFYPSFIKRVPMLPERIKVDIKND